jgi:hypothetical protein
MNIDFISAFVNRDAISHHLFLLIYALGLSFVMGMGASVLRGDVYPLIGRLYPVGFLRLLGRLNNPKRQKADLILRGLLAFLLVLACMGVYGSFIFFISTKLNMPIDIDVIHIVVISLCCNIGQAFSLLNFIRRSQQEQRGFFMLARSTATDYAIADSSRLYREAIYLVFQSFSIYGMGICVFTLLFGVYGALFYHFLNFTMVLWMQIRPKSLFIQPLSVILRLFNFIPHMLFSCLMVVAFIFVPQTSFIRAILALCQYQSFMQALAQGLKIVLGGNVTNQYGITCPRAWLGRNTDSAQLNITHIYRAFYLYCIMLLLMIMVMLLGVRFL